MNRFEMNVEEMEAVVAPQYYLWYKGPIDYRDGTMPDVGTLF